MSVKKLMSPEELKQLSELGFENFKNSVLEGQTFKQIINSIEGSALNGYTGWEKTLTSEDNIRELTIIRDHLKENGYYCEIETKDKQNIFGMNYKENKLVIKWGKNNPTSCN